MEITSSGNVGSVDSCQFPWMKCTMGCTPPGNKEVTLLPCLHVICSKECRDKFLSEIKEPENFRPCKLCFSRISKADVLKASKINAEKEFEKKMEPPCGGTVICQFCVDNIEATQYCTDCVLPLCEGCVQIHPRLRATIDHTIIPSLDEQRKKEVQEFKDKITQCQEHGKKTFTLWCAPCGKKLCKDCRPAHEGISHQVYNLEEKSTQLKENLEYVRGIMPKLDELAKALEQKLKSIRTTEWEKVCEDISKEFERVVQALVKRKMEINDEARAVFLKTAFEVQKQIKYVEICKKSTTMYLKAGEEVQSHCDDGAKVNFLKHADLSFSWIEDFDKTFHKDFDILAKKDWSFEVSSSGAQTVVEALQKLGKVTYGGKESESDVSVECESTELVPADLSAGVSNDSDSARTSNLPYRLRHSRVTHRAQVKIRRNKVGRPRKEIDQTTTKLIKPRKKRGPPKGRGRSLPCQVKGCSRVFKYPSDLMEHVFKHDKNYRPFECTNPGCSKAYNTATYQRTHSRLYCRRRPKTVDLTRQCSE